MLNEQEMLRVIFRRGGKFGMLVGPFARGDTSPTSAPIHFLVSRCVAGRAGELCLRL